MGGTGVQDMEFVGLRKDDADQTIRDDLAHNWWCPLLKRTS